MGPERCLNRGKIQFTDRSCSTAVGNGAANSYSDRLSFIETIRAHHSGNRSEIMFEAVNGRVRESMVIRATVYADIIGDLVRRLISASHNNISDYSSSSIWFENIIRFL